MTAEQTAPAADELPPPPGGLVQLSRLGRLVRKELSETLRDRRTLLTLVLMPLLLYPVLALGFRPILAAQLVAENIPDYRLAFLPNGQDTRILKALDAAEDALIRQGVYVRPTAEGVGAPATRPAAPLAQPLPQMEVVLTSDLEAAVRQGDAEVGLRVRPGGNGPADWEMLYAEDSPVGRDAARHVQRLLATPPGWWPGQVHLTAKPLEMPAQPPALLGLIPLVLLLMTITGAVYPAIDLTAGERERGTLEVLMAAPVPRLSLLLAKYTAVVTVAMLTGLVNLGAMALSIQLSGVGPRLLGGQELSPLVLVEVFLLLLLFTAFFSAVLLALASVARSFKEAQAYLVPLMVVALIPGVLSLLPGVRLAGPVTLVPLLNIVLLGRDLLAGRADPVAAAAVVGSTLVYALAAVGLAAVLFGQEAVLSGSPGGLSRFWRRKKED
jgi:ABC-2 type transport system permease protein/sodium transport system permease protein